MTAIPHWDYASDDLFERLQLDRETATVEDVHAAFRRLAKQFHPDVITDETARAFPNHAEIWLSLKEAYEVLSDPERLEKFRRTGLFRDDDLAEFNEIVKIVIDFFVPNFLRNPDDQYLLEAIRTHLRKLIGQAENTRKKAERVIAVTKKRRKAYRKKKRTKLRSRHLRGKKNPVVDSGVDVMDICFEKIVNDARDQANIALKQVEILSKVLEVLEEYECVSDLGELLDPALEKPMPETD